MRLLKYFFLVLTILCSLTVCACDASMSEITEFPEATDQPAIEITEYEITQTNEEYALAGKRFREIMNSNDTTLVATVNGSEITKQEVLLKQNIEELNKTRRDALPELVKSRVLAMEAEKQGLSVTLEDAIASSIKSSEAAKQVARQAKPEGYKTSKAMVDNTLVFINATGYTEAEYYAICAPSAQRLMLKNKLKRQFLDSLPIEEQADFDLREQKFEQYCDELVRKAEIKYY